MRLFTGERSGDDTCLGLDCFDWLALVGGAFLVVVCVVFSVEGLGETSLGRADAVLGLPGTSFGKLLETGRDTVGLAELLC